MPLHPSTFEYLKPTPEQLVKMTMLREATASYGFILANELPEGSDKTKILRDLRTLGMWVNVSITRHSDGSPRV